MHTLTTEILGVAIGGLAIGGIVGGALTGLYRAIDEQRDWPRWADALAIGGSYTIGIGVAAVAGWIAAHDLAHLGHAVSPLIAAIGAGCGESAWPRVRAAGLRVMLSRVEDATEGRR